MEWETREILGVCDRIIDMGFPPLGVAIVALTLINQ